MADLARAIFDKWGWAMLAAALSLAVAWGAFSARVATLERDLHALESEWRASNTANLKVSGDVATQLARLSEQVAALRAQLARIEARDRRTDASPATDRTAR